MRLLSRPPSAPRALAVALALLLALAGPAFAQDFIGDDLDNEYIGTPDPDFMLGNGGEDTLDGKGAADNLNGGADADQVFGGAGDDNLEGGSGNDDVYGDQEMGPDPPADQHGDDTLDGFSGEDQLFGDGGNDTIRGGPASDGLFGGPGDDELYADRFLNGTDATGADAGDDLLQGGDGDDVLYGGDGDDDLVGGEGNDILCGEGGDDSLVGGSGHDLACLHDDVVLVRPDTDYVIDLTLNDEVLDDEDDEEAARYDIGSPTPEWVTFHGLTGVLDITDLPTDFAGATLTYSARRLKAGITTTAEIQVVLDPAWDPSTALAAASSPRTAPYGVPRSVELSGTNAVAGDRAGHLTIGEGATTYAERDTPDGTASLALPLALGVGTHVITATYVPANGYLASATSTVRLTVVKDRSTTSASWKTRPTTVRAGRLRVVVKPKAGALKPASGKIKVVDGKRKVGSGKVRRGKAVVSVQRLPAGSHRLTVRYLGSRTHLGSKRTVRIVVPRR